MRGSAGRYATPCRVAGFGCDDSGARCVETTSQDGSSASCVDRRAGRVEEVAVADRQAERVADHDRLGVARAAIGEFVQLLVVAGGEFEQRSAGRERMRRGSSCARRR